MSIEVKKQFEKILIQLMHEGHYPNSKHVVKTLFQHFHISDEVALIIFNKNMEFPIGMKQFKNWKKRSGVI